MRLQNYKICFILPNIRVTFSYTYVTSFSLYLRNTLIYSVLYRGNFIRIKIYSKYPEKKIVLSLNECIGQKNKINLYFGNLKF